MQILEAEVALREYEISIVAGVRDVNDELLEDGVQTLIMYQVREIQSVLDFEKYLGETLWKEFAAYRREDTYQNDNFISEGLTTAELFENAREFINVASSELFKASTLQHSISSKLKNLLVIEAFKPIIKNFKIGNWIRIRVDGKICRLRLLRYEIDFDNLSNIDVGFSDVKQIRNGLTDLQSILNSASTMSSSYEATIRQVDQNKKAKKIVNDWVNKGLNMTQAKIVSNATDQNITWDEHGILCRQFDSTTDSYDDRQLKIINRGLYVTDNNWLTSKAGIGDFIFYNPETGQMEEAYGVIADTLVGNLILSQKVGIYNEGNTIKLDENGMALISDVTGGNTDVFRIQRKYLDDNDDEVIENVIYFDNEGNANFVGKITATSLRIVSSGSSSGVPISDYVDDIVDATLDSSVIIEQYLLFHSNADGAVTSSSPTAEEIEYYKTSAGGGYIYDEYWSDTCPIWQSGYYIWTRNKNVWGDSSITYSDPVLAEGLNSANSIANSAQSSANEITKVVQSNQDRIDDLDSDVDGLKINAEKIIKTITDFQVQQEGINATVTTVNEQMIEVQNYMSFDANGLTLGKSNDALKVNITNSKMSFKDGDDEVAYISSNKLYITQANITNKIIIGEYAFVPSPGHLSLVYNG